VKIADGKLSGYNTDADGFARAFEEQTGTGFQHKSVCILGAGGTARALAVKIALKDAEKVSIINRTEVRALELASYVNHVLINNGYTGEVAFAAVSGSAEALRSLNECDIIVNTTSVGLYPDINSSPIEQGFLFNNKQIVYDVIYNPAQTKLMADAKANGCKTVNGAGMLFYQGIKAFEIFMDTVVPVEISTCLMTDFLKYLGT
jgi:shikimate dehydrogenase